jgi:hypothetical protein
MGPIFNYLRVHLGNIDSFPSFTELREDMEVEENAGEEMKQAEFDTCVRLSDCQVEQIVVACYTGDKK